MMYKKRCKAITSKGRRCKATRINKSAYCYNHQKYTPNRFDFLKRHRNQITLGVILPLVIFLIQFFTSPKIEDINEEHSQTRKEINEEHSQTRKEINEEHSQTRKEINELKLLVKELLELPKANGAIIENIESYASNAVSDYNTMDSLLYAYSEGLKKEFPNGFALFSSDESGVILPLNKMPVLENMIVEWDKTRMVELTKEEYSIRFPDFIDTKTNGVFTNTTISGWRIKYNKYGGFKANNIEPIVMILEDYGSQIVFVISFM